MKQRQWQREREETRMLISPACSDLRSVSPGSFRLHRSSLFRLGRSGQRNREGSYRREGSYGRGLQERGKLREREAAGERGRVDSGIFVFHIRGTTRSRGEVGQKKCQNLSRGTTRSTLFWRTKRGTERLVPSRPTYQTRP